MIAITWHPWQCLHLLLFLIQIDIHCLSSFPCLEGLYLCDVHKELLWPTMFVSSSLQMLDICGRVDLISLPEEGLWSLTCLNNLSIMDCHGLFVSSRKLGFSDNEDDDDTVKKFQGLRSLCTIRGNCFNSKVVCLPREIQHVTSLETLSVILV